MARDQSPGTSTCARQTEFIEGEGKRDGEAGGCFWLAYVFCQSEMSSLSVRTIKWFSWTCHLDSTNVKWLAVSPPYPILARPKRFRKLSLSPLPTLPGMASANPVLQPSSSQWRKPDQEMTLSVVLKRAREPTLSLGWALGQGLTAPKEGSGINFPTTPRDEALGEAKPWLSHSLLTTSCLAVAVTVLVFLSELAYE